MREPYTEWTKARLRAELRSRSLPDRGSTSELRRRLREDDAGGDSGGSGSEAEQQGAASRGGPAPTVPARLLEDFRAVTGREADTVASIRMDAAGGHATIDVVGCERVPPSTDVLLSYEVTFDAHGGLLDCARTGSYLRGRPVPRNGPGQ